MNNQRHLFQLPDDVHYLNGAYMSPLLKSVEEAGIEGMIRKRNPFNIKAKDFFEDAEIARGRFGKLINCDAQNVVIIPSVSYGLMSAFKNLPVNNGSTAVMVSDEFPSDYYTVERWCKEKNKNIKIISAPGTRINRGEEWNNIILSSINNDTAVVVLSSVHWADGTLFKLKEIGKKCKQTDTMFVVDGTQSVGVLPMDVKELNIDALICASYKWLLGPYSIGLAYYSEYFNSGSPVEETWMNKSNAQDFAALSAYVDGYTPGAGRYNVGEFGNFILIPMVNRALEQILNWSQDEMQKYSGKITIPLIKFFKENNFWVEEDGYRPKHLFGILLPQNINSEKLLYTLQERKIAVSLRGKSIRVSCHIYNTENDIDALISSLDELIK